jgi:hypothetical protein
MFDKTAFVEHPISKAEKQQLNIKGFKVVDVRFKPEKLSDGDKVIMKPKAAKPEAEK